MGDIYDIHYTNMNESQIKDEILRYCVNDGIDDNFVIATEIISDVFSQMSNEEMKYYISEILKYPEFIIDCSDYNETYVLQPQIATVKFLEKGGFSQIEEVETQKMKKALKKEKFEFTLAESNIKANKLNKKVARQNLKNERNNLITTWINIAIGVLNLGLLMWQILKD